MSAQRSVALATGFDHHGSLIAVSSRVQPLQGLTSKSEDKHTHSTCQLRLAYTSYSWLLSDIASFCIVASRPEGQICVRRFAQSIDAQSSVNAILGGKHCTLSSLQHLRQYSLVGLVWHRQA